MKRAHQRARVGIRADIGRRVTRVSSHVIYPVRRRRRSRRNVRRAPVRAPAYYLYKYYTTPRGRVV